MNCSYNCRMCRVCRYIRRHAKNFIIKTLCMFNGFSLIFWACLLDSSISWQPYVVMMVNFLFLCLVGYVNGCFYEEYEKEGGIGGSRKTV